MHDEAAEIDENEFALAVRDEANRLTLQRQIQLGGKMPKQREQTEHDEELAAVARHAQRENDEWIAWCAKQRAEREAAAQRARATSYPMPVLSGRVTIAPVTIESWERRYSVDEIAAIDDPDRHPEWWPAVKDGTRRYSGGLAVHFTRICPRHRGLEGERMSFMKSAIGMALTVLADGEVPIGLSPSDTAFYEHFVQPPDQRVAWAAARTDLFHNAGPSLGLAELLTKVDREGDVFTTIRDGIRRALEVFRTRSKSHDPWRSA